MPYRSLETGGPACYRHAAAAAAASCTACLQPICEVCVVYELTQPHCPLCARRVRQGRSLRRAAGAVALGLLAAAGVAGIAFVVSRERPYDYGIQTGRVRALAEQLSLEPCDRGKIVELTESMVRAGDYRGALARADQFFGRCGPHPRLLWVTYTAHERRNEHDLAARDATQLIEEYPGDKDYWWWRGLAYEEMGDLEKAASDYRRALDVEPRLSGIPFNLATVLERMGKPCDAKAPIEHFLLVHPDVSDRERVDARLAELDKRCHALPPARAP